MSYNLTATLIDHNTFWRELFTRTLTTEENELFDSILSGQNYSQAHFNYQRTYNNADVMRKQLIDLIENRNHAYFQLLIFAANGFLAQLPEIIFHASHEDQQQYLNFWGKHVKGDYQTVNFTADELCDWHEFDLIRLEDEMTHALLHTRLPIGQYPAMALYHILEMVRFVRREYETDPSLQNIDFSID